MESSFPGRRETALTWSWGLSHSILNGHGDKLVSFSANITFDRDQLWYGTMKVGWNGRCVYADITFDRDQLMSDVCLYTSIPLAT